MVRVGDGPGRRGRRRAEPGTRTALGEQVASGQADLPSARGSLEEIRAFVEALDVQTYFTCNHASNYLPMT